MNWKNFKQETITKFGQDKDTSNFIDFARGDGLSYKDILEYFPELPLHNSGEIDFEIYNYNLYGDING